MCRISSQSEYNLGLGIDLCRGPGIKLQTSGASRMVWDCRIAMFRGSKAYTIKIFQEDSRAAVFGFYVKVWLAPVSLKTQKKKSGSGCHINLAFWKIKFIYIK